MTKTERAVLKSVGPRQHWYPVPYATNAKEIDSLVEQGEIIYDPRCEAAMRPDVWERATDRIRCNAEGWEALQRAEFPEAHIFRPETPPVAENAE